MISSDTIYALSSAPGRAGVAVVRISGPNAGLVVKKLCHTLPVPRRATLQRITRAADGALLDRGLVLWFPRPNSFTGEDMAEFQVHGGAAVIQALFTELAAIPGLRAADPGEFTRRAFGNGKFDLMEVEGLADLIESRTERQRRQAILRVEGGARELLGAWRKSLVAVLGKLEATIDFSDEAHVSECARTGSEMALRGLVGQIRQELERGKQGERLREGVRVVLAGMPNVGKSSLLNRLAGKDAAIVSGLPGTTRDIIEVHVNLSGIPVIFQDTAGVREATGDAIETEGMARAQAAVKGADLVLWLAAPDVAGSDLRPKLDSEPLWIWNKSDLRAPPECARGEPYLAVSTTAGEGVGVVEEAVVTRLHQLVQQGEAAIVTRQRHRDCLQSMLEHLDAATNSSLPLEIVAEEVRLAAASIGRLTGHIEVESLLDEIFREFCIGK
ncbi:MAG TPA: tRNA uridine-5-carboxymethylaminomethyl(34) synthesis GTPase MnmE [Aestuariivirgaceae bacterium]